MKLIVLAAGLGKRFLPATKPTPKGKNPILGKPLLKHIVEPYLKYVSDIIFVINNPLGRQIKKYFKKNYFGHKVFYRIQAKPKGTMDALLVCQDLINENELFCVCNGDDLLQETDIKNAIEEKVIGIGISKKIMPKSYLGIKVENECVLGFVRHTTKNNYVEDIFYNGFNILDKQVFEFQPISTRDGELGLPQTLLAKLDTYSLKAFPFERWETVNSPPDIAKATKFIKSL